MNKEELKQELLEKVKQGLKPSDLRKSKLSFLRSKEDDLKKKKNKKPPKPEKDLGYESGEDKSKIPTPPLPETKQIKDLKKQIKFWSNTAQTHLTNLQQAQAKITNLEEENKNLITEKDKQYGKFWTENENQKARHKQKLTELYEQIADMTEGMRQKNKQIEIIATENQKNLQKANKATESFEKASQLLNKQSESVRKAQELIKQQAQSISELQSKLQEKSIKDLKNPTSPTEKKTKTFLCSECNQAKPPQALSRVFGKFSFCLECSKQARQVASEQKSKPQPQEFTCHLCEQTKTEIPTLMKLDSTLIEYKVCSSCRPLAKEFNEADLITDELWEKYPYSSASEILEKEFGIKPKE